METNPGTMDIQAAVGVRERKKKEEQGFAQKIALLQMKGKYLPREIFPSHNVKSAKLRFPTRALQRF